MTNDNLGKIAKYLDEWKPIGVKEILGRDNALLLFDEVCQLSNLVEAMKKENAELKAAIDEDKYIFTQHGKTLAGLDKKDEENEGKPEKKKDYQWGKNWLADQMALLRGEFKGGDDEQTE